MKEKYTQLTQEDRINIYLFLQQEFSYSEIAEKIGKSKSTISREKERNTGERGYRWKQAHNFAMFRKTFSFKNIRLTESIANKIVAKLSIRWSPEQISNYVS